MYKKIYKFNINAKKGTLINLFIIVFVTIIVFGAYTSNFYNVNSVKLLSNNRVSLSQNLKQIEAHSDIVHRYLDKRKTWKTSNLGSLLFKFRETNNGIGNNTKSGENKRFIVLIWKHWDWLKNRHIYNFNNDRKPNPFNECSVENCILTGDEKYLETADAVVVHIQRGVFPKMSRRNTEQRWIFLNDESPLNAFSMASSLPKLSDLANVFNWSMTYRSDADVPVPYGRTVPLSTPLLRDTSNKFLTQLVPYWNTKRRDKLASVLMSNCAVSRRMEYLNELEKYLPLDVYGRCSKNHKHSCPGHFKSDCNVTSQYLFYLVLENSQCREYLTEKAFNNAYEKGAIPVIMGPKPDECEKILPPNSFLHINNFDKPQDLARYIINLSANDDALLNFHKWRNHFKIASEHGYFGTKSFHYCRVCEALNYNDKSEKIYDEHDLRTFLDPAGLCF